MRSGWSQETLAAEMRRLGYDGWQQSTIAKVESASRPLRVNELIDLCNVLSLDIAEALGSGSAQMYNELAASMRFQRASDEAERLEIEYEGLARQAEQVVQDLNRARQRAESARKSLMAMGLVEVGDGWVRPEDVEADADGHH